MCKKIEELEKEKARLLAEVESLREKVEVKACKLENEVSTLRKQVKTLEGLLKVKDS